MVGGGGIKRDDGLPAISSTNIFAALESRRRKKKASEKESRNREAKQIQPVWAPLPVTVTSWADCEDDDDYFATVAPLPSVWTSDQPSETRKSSAESLSQEEESEGDEEIEEEAEDDFEDQERVEYATSELTSNKPMPAPMIYREPEKQLSKKELKKKELAELEAVLAELGLNPKTENDSKLHDDRKQNVVNGEVDVSEEVKDSGPASLQEGKSGRRRKVKKEKSFKEAKEEEAPAVPAGAIGKESETTGDTDSNSALIDPTKVMKKLTTARKKKSSKEADTAAKVAAAEAAARAAKLVAAKRKEKNHYNQQPVR